MGFIAAGLAHDDAARRCFSGGRNAELLQRGRVHNRTVHRDVPYQHRVVREGLVEVVAIEQAAVRHDRVVIAVGLDQLALRDAALRPELPDRSDDAGYVLTWPRGRCVHLRLVGHRQRADVVAVRIEKSGQQGLAGEVHDFRGVATVGGLHVGTRAHGKDLAVLDGQCLGGWLRIIDRNDVAADVDRVGRRRGCDVFDPGLAARAGKREARHEGRPEDSSTQVSVAPLEFLHFTMGCRRAVDC